MIDDAFVFDCVAHVFNFEKKNAFGPPGEMFSNHLYASLAATINFLVRAPRMFAEILGKLLFWCGEDKIIYGSEAVVAGAAPLVTGR
jgi:hypothetical protein